MEEIKKLPPDIVKALREPLPPESIKPHPTKAYLSTIKAIYVVERINAVFGIGKWTLTSEVIQHPTKENKGMVVVKAFLKIPEYGISLESYGGNDNTDEGDAYKGAVTDALTKMGSFLEIGIDVFKGLRDQPKEDKPKEEKEVKPTQWLNRGTENWKKVVVYLQTGGSITEVEKKYKISKPDREQLLSEAI